MNKTRWRDWGGGGTEGERDECEIFGGWLCSGVGKRGLSGRREW